MFGYGQGLPTTIPLSAVGATTPGRGGLFIRQGVNDALSFATYVEGHLRTCGVVITRPDHSALDLNGLDLSGLSALAVGDTGATAGGKLLLMGADGSAVFQTRPGRNPELACCGNAAAVIPFLDPHRHVRIFTQKGVIDAVQCKVGDRVHQRWSLPAFTFREEQWHGRTVVRCGALNEYAVISSPLPAGMDLQAARQALSGQVLTNKLVVLESRAGTTHARFINDSGIHGAAPATGLATLSLLAKTCLSIAVMLRGGTITFDSPEGLQHVRLPRVTHDRSGRLCVQLPTVAVRLATMATVVPQ